MKARGLGSLPSVPALRDWLRNHVHPDDARRLGQALTAWGEAGPGHLAYRYRVRRPNGEVRQFHSHSRADETGRGLVRYGVVIDITDQRRSELALEGAEERVGLAVRGAGLGTWEVDLETLDEQ